MKFIKACFSLVLIMCLFFNCTAQESKLWENFKNAKAKNMEPILPDFSYAGYQYSEVGIPTVDYKIFDVTTFGANPLDTKSDKEAINKAIKAAKKNGEGIIYFPKGKYYVNTDKDDKSIIKINSSKIVFRGEERDSTILFFETSFPPKNPNKKYSSPYAIQAAAKKKEQFLTKITKDAQRETHIIHLEDASKFAKGDWIIIKLKNNDIELVKKDIYPLPLNPSWSKMIKQGVMVNERHQIAKVTGNSIYLVEPIYYPIESKYNWEVAKFNYIHHIGFENLTFEGNWKKKFVHHRSAEDDGGWSIIRISRTVNSWIKDVTFKNVNRAAIFSASASCTALNVLIEGNYGHNAISAAGSTGILIANSQDKAGMHHSFGASGGSTINTVIWHSKYASHTCFESHASQPRNTLLDNVEGGFFAGRAGGAKQNLPNHNRYLVLWNFKETDAAESNFRFVAIDSDYWKIVPPIIVGFHGSGTTFKEDETQVIESLGTPVKPASLFEKQLELRLGKLPDWIKEISAKQ